MPSLRFKTGILGGLLALTISGCGGGAAAPSTSASVPGAANSKPAGATASSAPASSAAASAASASASAQPAGAGKTVNIGIEAIMSTVGALPQYANGAMAYFHVVNDNGGVNGYKFVWEAVDNANSAPQTLTVTRQLIAQNKPAAIIGFGTVSATALKPLASQLKVPLLISSNGDLFVPGQRYWYSAIPSYRSMWKFGVDLAKSHFKAKDIALVYQADAFGEPANAVVPNYAKAQGLSFLTSIGIPNTTTGDFTPYAARLKASGAHFVILAVATALLDGTVKASNQLGYQPTWLTNWTAEDLTIKEAVGPAIKKLYAMDFQPPIESTNNAAVQEYKAGMKKYYPRDVNSEYAEQGWDYAALVTYAVRQVTSAGKDVTPDTLDQALSHITNVDMGMLTGLTYNDTEHNGITKMALLEWGDNGPYHQVGNFTTLPNPS